MILDVDGSLSCGTTVDFIKCFSSISASDTRPGGTRYFSANKICASVIDWVSSKSERY